MLAWLVAEPVKDLDGGSRLLRTTVWAAERGAWRSPTRRRERREVGWLEAVAPEEDERERERTDQAARLAAREVALRTGDPAGEPAARVRRARLTTRHAEYEITDADGELLAAVEHRYGSLWRLRRPRWTVRAAGTEQSVVGRQGRILLWWLWWPSLPLQLATYFASFCQINPIQVWYPLSIRLRGRREWGRRRQVMRYRPRRELLQIRDPQAWDERVVAGLLYLVERPLGIGSRSLDSNDPARPQARWSPPSSPTPAPR